MNASQSQKSGFARLLAFSTVRRGSLDRSPSPGPATPTQSGSTEPQNGPTVTPEEQARLNTLAAELEFSQYIQNTDESENPIEFWQVCYAATYPFNHC